MQNFSHMSIKKNIYIYPRDFELDWDSYIEKSKKEGKQREQSL